MLHDIDGDRYDTDQMLDLHIGPVESWMGGVLRLDGVYADRQGRLYVLTCNPDQRVADGKGGWVTAPVLTRCSLAVVRYLVERFELPAAYLRPGKEN